MIYLNYDEVKQVREALCIGNDNAVAELASAKRTHAAYEDSRTIRGAQREVDCIAAALRIMEAEGVKASELPPIAGFGRFSDSRQRGLLVVFDRRLSDDELTIARAALSAPAAPSEQEPVAYMCFAENGNIRVWAEKDNLGARQYAEKAGLTLQPVFAAPQAPPAAANGWISVEDRLPPECELVLTSGAKRVGMAVMQYSRRDDWQIETASEWHSAYPPKFWQPLPAAPQ